jgi:hypothetical protein
MPCTQGRYGWAARERRRRQIRLKRKPTRWKAALVKTAKTSPAWKAVPKALRKGDAVIVHALNTIAAEKGDPERATIGERIAHTLELNPEIRKAAERIVREQAKAVKIAL